MKNLFFNMVIVNFFFLLSFNIAHSQTEIYTFNDSWGKNGYEIVSSSSESIILNYSIQHLYITDTIIGKDQMQQINIDGFSIHGNTGAPALPVISKIFAIPQGAIPKIKIISYRTEEFWDISVVPVSDIPLETDDKPVTHSKNDKIYKHNVNFPSQIVYISETKQIRNTDCVFFGICPFQYNPVSKQLIVYRDIIIEISFEGGNGIFGGIEYRSKWFEPIMKQNIFNYSMLPPIDYNQKYLEKTGLTGYEYVIITPTNPEFRQWADSLKKFRTEQGILTTVVPLDSIPEGNTVTGIKSWINNAYNNWDIKPVAILLLGDYGLSQNDRIIADYYQYDGNICATDNSYADINNDFLPDIIISRIPAENEEQLRVMVLKCLDYERKPPIDNYFYLHPITSMGWQTDRWFQISAETIGGFWKNKLHKEPVRINSLIIGDLNIDPWSTADNTYPLIDIFGEKGFKYIPDKPQELGGFDGGKAIDIVNAMNKGAFMILHRDHGGTYCWGHPYFTNNNISNINNTNLSFVLSIDCSTGKFDNYTECLTEKFMRQSGSAGTYGASSMIAASGLSYSFINDIFLFGIIENFWPDFLNNTGNVPVSRTIFPAFGNVAGKYFLYQCGWFSKSNTLETTCNLYHMFGDAFQVLYSEVPGKLEVEHDPFLLAGADHIIVKADTGALIVITANNIIISKSMATGLPLSIPIQPQSLQTKISITATKENFIRYSNEIETMNANGPYFIIASWAVNDPLPLGNNNGQPDFEEMNYLNFSIKNIGFDTADLFTVELKSDDEYVTFSKKVMSFRNLPPGEILHLKDCFSYSVANNIPDKHKIVIKIKISSGIEDWYFKIYLTANAPFLIIGDISYSDTLAGGNSNGLINTYESIVFNVPIANIGHSNVKNVKGILCCSDPNVIIETNYFIDHLSFNESKNTSITVKIKEGVTEAPILFSYKLFSENYMVEKSFSKTAKIYYEDWETNNFNKMPWVLNGNKDWLITSGIEKFEGFFTAKSGKIKDRETSNLDIYFSTIKKDTIYFYKKVSSEPYDYLKFFVDDFSKPVLYWSGIDDDWSLVKHPIEAGPHYFRWQYIKNWRVSGGNDCAWIDCIVFPMSSDSIRYKRNFSNSISCFPNPFNNNTTISFSLHNDALISLSLFDFTGKKIRSIYENEKLSKGYYQVPFNKGILLSGLYFFILTDGINTSASRVIITSD